MAWKYGSGIHQPSTYIHLIEKILLVYGQLIWSNNSENLSTEDCLPPSSGHRTAQNKGPPNLDGCLFATKSFQSYNCLEISCRQGLCFWKRYGLSKIEYYCIDDGKHLPHKEINENKKHLLIEACKARVRSAYEGLIGCLLPDGRTPMQW